MNRRRHTERREEDPQCRVGGSIDGWTHSSEYRSSRSFGGNSHRHREPPVNRVTLSVAVEGPPLPAPRARPYPSAAGSIMRDLRHDRKARYAACRGWREGLWVSKFGGLWVGAWLALLASEPGCGPGEGAPPLNLESPASDTGGETTAAPIQDDSSGPATEPAAPAASEGPVDSGSPEPKPEVVSCENKATVFNGGYRCAQRFEQQWLSWWSRYGVLPEDWCQCLALSRASRSACTAYQDWGITDAESIERGSPDELEECTPQGKHYRVDRWRETYRKWFKKEAEAGRCYGLADGSNSCRRLL